MRTLFLICSFFMSTLSTAQAATVNVVPSSNIVNSSTFFVMVSGTGFPETYGATLSLSFDPRVVNVTEVVLATGSPFDYISSSVFDNEAGEVQFISILAPLAGALPSGSFDAFRVNFSAIEMGEADIRLRDDGASKGWTGADFSLIPEITYNQANVISTVPQPAVVWLLLSGLGVLVLAKRFTFARGLGLVHAVP